MEIFSDMHHHDYAGGEQLFFKLNGDGLFKANKSANYTSCEHQ